MLRVTKLTDYATLVLTVLAAQPSRVFSASELAERARLEAPTVSKVLKPLAHAGLVEGFRGVHGGYELARASDKLTVGEVVRLMDGPLAPSPCASQSAHVPCPTYRCPSESSCALRGLWTDVRDAIAGVLDSTTFADLTNRQREARGAPRYAI